MTSGPAPVWHLTVYTVGMPPVTERALRNLRALCRESLEVEPVIQIVDLREHPGLAEAERIFAVPTIVRKAPRPDRRVIGDLSDRARARAGLDLEDARG